MYDKEYIESVLDEFSSLPTFEDGRIDFSHSKKAPVLNCFVLFKDKVLLLKRSDKVGSYKGKWNVVGGYIDEPVSVLDKAIIEVQEELGITKEQIEKTELAKKIEVQDPQHKTWIVHPVRIYLKQEPNIVLDWEHTEYKWITPQEFDHFDNVPGLINSWNAFQ